MKTLGLLLASALLVGACHSQPARDTERFVAVAAGVIDRQTGLLWASADNGEPLDWQAAQRFCESYEQAGIGDWRLPTAAELTGLYTDVANPAGYRLTPLINLTGASLWTSEPRTDPSRYEPPGLAIYVDFSEAYYAGEPMLAPKSRAAEMSNKLWPHLRALAVRRAP